VTLRALSRGSLLITIANLVPRAGAFLLLPLYARFLTQGDFGAVSLAGSTALLLAITCRLGMDAALLRLHFDVEGADRRALYATVATLSLAGVIGIVSIGGVIVLVVTARDSESLVVWLLALGIAAANTFQFVPSVWLRATEQTGRYLGLAFGAFIVAVAATVVLVVFMRLGAPGSLGGQLAGAAVMAIAALVLLMRMRPWRLRRDLAGRALVFGLPLLPHAVAGWALNLSDRWLLALLLGVATSEALAQIGVYSLGYQLGYAIGLAAISFNAAWLPFLYRVGRDHAGRHITREATTIVVAFFSWMAGTMAVMAPDLVSLMAPPEWAGAADVTVVVSFAFALNAAGLMLASALYLHRDTGVLPILTVAAVGVNVATNIALIPALGIMGAAWATAASYGTLALLVAYMSVRRHAATFDVVRLTAAGGMMVAPSLVATLVQPADGIVAAAWHAGLAGIAAAVALGIIREPWNRLRKLVPAGWEAESAGSAVR
jgi:O-antigen/teichoic acid export membrane protein